MRTSNFGRTSLADLLLTVERYLIERRLAPTGSTDDSLESVASHASPNRLDAHHGSDEVVSQDANATAESLLALTATTDRLGTPSERWSVATEGLKSVLATAADVIGTPTLADALRPEMMRLARRMGLDSALRSVGLHEAMLGVPSLPALIARRLRETLNALDERQSAVIQTRLAQVPPATLENVGLQLGVTRERVRQIQVKLQPRIEAALGQELRVVASTLQERLDPLTPADELERQIDRIIPDASETAATLFRNAVIRAMGLTLNGELYTTDRAEQVVRDVRLHARDLADDVGLVQEQDLIAVLPDDKWLRFWPWLRRRSGLHSFYGSLALRDSAKARAKAALLSLERPSTRDEIGAVCGQDPNRVGANLSNIPSVAKADRDRWGLRDWIDDEYDGIVGEIVQRIEEDGGVTTTERLLREIPTKFNVSPQSVRAYMYSARFDIRNGSIRLANPASIRLRDLGDVIDGRDEDGAPYWTFVVDDRYFQGYSVVGVPPEFAKALGCEPDSGVDVEIQNLSDCRALSLNWRLASLTGASLGCLAKPLRLLGLQPGDRVRVTIASSRAVVLGLHDGGSQRTASSEADATLERILRRRRAI
ncbi:MAG: hypothetical protein OXM56_03840 [Gammaproteobacteria bacterium]|nr:hypothetical protein [Gammaproteobacteria bacterium]